MIGMFGNWFNILVMFQLGWGRVQEAWWLRGGGWGLGGGGGSGRCQLRGLRLRPDRSRAGLCGDLVAAGWPGGPGRRFGGGGDKLDGPCLPAPPPSFVSSSAAGLPARCCQPSVARPGIFPGSADFPILPPPLPSSTLPPLDSMAPPDSRKWTKGGCVYVSAACFNSDDARLRVSTGLSRYPHRMEVRS